MALIAAVAVAVAIVLRSDPARNVGASGDAEPSIAQHVSPDNIAVYVQPPPVIQPGEAPSQAPSPEAEIPLHIDVATAPCPTLWQPPVANANEPDDSPLDLEEAMPRIALAAGHRLDLLTRNYNLSPEQRVSIFRIYATASAKAVGITVTGDDVALAPMTPEEAPAAVEEAVFEELTDAQQDQYIDEAVDRDLWWTEIVGQLEQDLDEGLEVFEDVNEAEEPTADDDAADPGDAGAHDGGNVLDLLGF